MPERLGRSTLADWVGKSTALLEPLADAIGRHVLAGRAIFADDTPVKMLAPGAGKTATARLWAYGRDERPWGSSVPPASWYRFSADRKGQHPKDHLVGYRGWMHADGYAGFNDLYRSGGIREVACMAHVRRKFVDVHRAQGSAIADEAIRRIAQLHAVEKEARGSPPDHRVEIRQAKAKPIFDELEAWLHAQLHRISGKSPLAAARDASATPWSILMVAALSLRRTRRAFRIAMAAQLCCAHRAARFRSLKRSSPIAAMPAKLSLTPQSSPSRSCAKNPDQIGFAVQPRRWVVERFFAWINRNRRLAKDFEATIASANAFLYAASIMLLVRRLARST